MCWENRETQLRLLDRQETLGMGAWSGDQPVGLLHCYQVNLPDYDDSDFPWYGRDNPVGWPLGWPLLVTRERRLTFDGPVWGHACFHVGFTQPDSTKADPSWFGRGIGTDLCRASVEWARDHGYAAVIAQGGTPAAFEYNIWMGCLPWTSYAALGFEPVAQEEDGERLPWWTGENGASPEVQEQVQAALASGKGPADLCARLMVLRL